LSDAGQPRLGEWGLRVALVLGAVLLALGGAEAALRAYHALKQRVALQRLPPVDQRAVIPSDDPALIFEFNPGWKEGVYAVNSHGMADREVSITKPPGVTRVAFVGDSVTANFKLQPREVIYPTLVEEMLNARARRAGRVQTLDFAVNGYSILQSLRLAQTQAKRFEPDVLVVQICLNDPRPSPTPPYVSATPPTPLFTLNLVMRRLGGDRFVAYEYVDRHYDDEGWANFRRAFEGFRELKDGGLPVLMVLFPYLRPSAYESWGYQEIHRGIRAEADRVGLPLLDLYETFSEAGLIRPDPDLDPIHPGPEGHRRAAEAIVAELAGRRMLPAESSP
jgi:lysophospholipase L1-like esterase